MENLKKIVYFGFLRGYLIIGIEARCKRIIAGAEALRVDHWENRR